MEIVGYPQDRNTIPLLALQGHWRLQRSPCECALHVLRLWVDESCVSSFDYFLLRFFFRLAFAILTFCFVEALRELRLGTPGWKREITSKRSSFGTSMLSESTLSSSGAPSMWIREAKSPIPICLCNPARLKGIAFPTANSALYVLIHSSA